MRRCVPVFYRVCVYAFLYSTHFPAYGQRVDDFCGKPCAQLVSCASSGTRHDAHGAQFRVGQMYRSSVFLSGRAAWVIFDRSVFGCGCSEGSSGGLQGAFHVCFSFATGRRLFSHACPDQLARLHLRSSNAVVWREPRTLRASKCCAALRPDRLFSEQR